MSDSVANMAWDPLVSAGRTDDSGVLARGANCTNVHLSRLTTAVQKAGVDVHDISLAIGIVDVLGDEVSPANSYCSGTGKRKSRIRSVARTVFFAPSHQRAMELVSGHESFLVRSDRGAVSILDASFKLCAGVFLGFRRVMVMQWLSHLNGLPSPGRMIALAV